jgi:serine/threonine protein kinase
MSLNDFECGKALGSGSFGNIYLTRERNHLSIVALKVITKESIEVGYEDDLLAEILIQAKLQHDNILPVFSFFYDNKNIYLILEYIADGSLCEHVHDGRSVSEPTAARYVANLVAALDYIHSNDIIHQDLRTENLLLGKTGNLIVADFGWAVSAVNNPYHKMSTNNDNEYWAPEMYGGLCGKEGDIWALGVLLYEFLVGTSPFGTKALSYLLIVCSEIAAFHIQQKNVFPTRPRI